MSIQFVVRRADPWSLTFIVHEWPTTLRTICVFVGSTPLSTVPLRIPTTLQSDEATYRRPASRPCERLSTCVFFSSLAFEISLIWVRRSLAKRGRNGLCSAISFNARRDAIDLCATPSTSARRRRRLRCPSGHLASREGRLAMRIWYLSWSMTSLPRPRLRRRAPRKPRGLAHHARGCGPGDALAVLVILGDLGAQAGDLSCASECLGRAFVML
ncbi:hypothetical protein BD626DRAFT_611 [Schizophyllum amplum]|uniref:Uncharacterized protein n=1 Tax=Schizophyllum amplum TaxID=97359 RepID=A0A550CVI2_9AGAR|nr:hypothetical protein BD626DRAFT_611 [Auriculariopsis ampla]